MKQFQRLSAYLAACAVSGLSFVALAAGPSWWMSRGVLSTNGTIVTNDFAPTTLGQLKWMATQAKNEFVTNLPGGASTSITALVSGFATTNNYQAALIGQGKWVAKPFYDQLINVGYTNGYPWGGTNVNDFAPLLIGQLKTLFNFDPGYDSDADSLPDWWETYRFGDLSHNGSADDDGDGYNNHDEYWSSTNPTNSASHPPSIMGTISYAGSQTGLIHVVAATNPSGWTSAQLATISNTGSYAITHLPTNTSYWVKAFRDTNGNGTNDASEAAGTYTNNPVVLTNTIFGADISLADGDGDGDGFSDLVETAARTDPHDASSYPPAIGGTIRAAGGRIGTVRVVATAAYTITNTVTNATLMITTNTIIDPAPLTNSASLVLYYPFNDVGSLTTDQSGNGNDAVIYNQDTDDWDFTTNGANGGALQMHGSEFLTASTSIGLLSDGTFSIWINSPAHQTHELISDYSNSNADQVLAYLVDGSTAYFQLGAYDSNFTTTMSAGVWHHLVVTWTPTVLAAYFDGGQVFSNSAAYDGVSFTDSLIGTWTGRMDEISVFTRALSSNEVAQMYSSSTLETNILTSAVTSTTAPFVASAAYSNGTYWLSGVLTGMNYQVQAYEDINSNAVADVGEPCTFFTNNPVVVTGMTARLNINMDMDSDGDGIPDWWEMLYSLNPLDASDALADADGDGFCNLAEYLFGTNPGDSSSVPATLSGATPLDVYSPLE